MKKILILGGTGAMGISLIKILENSSYQIYVTSRQQKDSYKNIHYIKGNAHDDNFLKNLLINSYDCIIDFMVYNTEEFKTKVELFLNSTQQYIFLSSSRVYAKSCYPITEDSPRLLDVSNNQDYLKTDEYALAKARQENILIESGKKNYTIIRPYITYNDNRLQLGVLEKEYWLERVLNNHTIVFSKDIAEHYTTLTYGYDVAYLMFKLIGRENALGEAFHITTHESMKWKDILDIYIKVLQKNGISAKVVWTNDSSLVEHGLGNCYQIHYDRLYDRKFNNHKILEITESNDYSFVPIKSGLEECLNNFINNNINFISKSYKLDALFDRLCGERTSIFMINSIKEKIKYIVYRYL